MTRAYVFEIRSRVSATREELWRHSAHMSGVNLELRPLMRMTYPDAYRVLDLSASDLHKTLFRSKILLFGLLPIEIYDVTMEEFEPGRRFLERSPTLTLHWWQHERTLTDLDGGCLVTDRLKVSPRLALLGRPVSWLVRIVFRNRHRNLRRLFGELAGEQLAAVA